MNKFVFRTSILFYGVFLISFANCSILNSHSFDFHATRMVRHSPVISFMDFVEKISADWTRQEIARNPLYVKRRGAHLNHSRELILKAAELSLQEQQGDATKRALVVGAGNCLDIPIKELTEMFDEVYLLDVAYRTTGSIVEEGRYFELRDTGDGWQAQECHLTEEQRSKLRFINEDATGGAVFEIIRKVHALVENNTAISQQDVFELIQNIPISGLPFEEDMFDLITSSTVFSDFLTLVRDYMMYVLDREDAAFFVNDTYVNRAFIELNEEIGRHHIAEANRMLKSTGRFYFSACIFEAEIYKPIGGSEVRRVSWQGAANTSSYERSNHAGGFRNFSS